MTKCPFFGLCGGCKYDFTAPEYRTQKLCDLPRDVVDAPVWGLPGARRRADFVARPGHFGFYKSGSHDIVDIQNCPNMLADINANLPSLASLPWRGESSVLVTRCDNGIVVNVSSDVPYTGPDMRTAVQKLPAGIIRFTWNGVALREYIVPEISFGDTTVPFLDSGFLQPTTETEAGLRQMVVDAATGATRVADLFCGMGNFTFATGADGFDIVGVGTRRDLFKRPLSARQLNLYDVVIMDPPRAGAFAQTKELAASNVRRVIYVSCNPATWSRDRAVLVRAGYKMTKCVPVDQFVGTAHWEIFSVFDK
ncbi:MAG: class I SAM-dependent RNA methyltransferase [Alphaproteobacteria bacterium]|nr:class I SAM-dependent RNA methyltransferase [Alphaproteobacteria bacterium]